MAEMLYQRDVYGKALAELGAKNNSIVVLDADLSSSTRTSFFRNAFPERFFNFGVAEQNMMAAAAGLASCGKIVFCSTFAIFASGRAWDQIRNTVCYNNSDVKIVASHAGISVGPDGASHQALEDIALMRVIPNMTIVVPGDGPETKDAILAAASCPGPFYIRIGRAKVTTLENRPTFKLGKASVMLEGEDVLLIACGIMVEYAIKAAQQLKKEGIKAAVINLHTLRPFDTEAVVSYARKVKGIVVCEEHTVVGGLASAVDEVVSEHCPRKVLRIGIKHRFGQSGEPEELFKEYQLLPEDIIKAAKSICG